MKYLRFRLDLAIPLDAQDRLPNALRAVSKLSDIPGLGTDTRIEVIQTIIRQLKSFASKINVGNQNEELTVEAKSHICMHEEGLPCSPEKDVVGPTKVVPVTPEESPVIRDV